MKYERPQERGNQVNEFSTGTHTGQISKVVKTRSKKGNDMFVLTVTGENEENGVYFLTFGTEYTEANLSYILASIQDNGVDIPDEIDFGFNKDTFYFLTNKDVYIRVEEQDYNGKKRQAIVDFIPVDEYAKDDMFADGITSEDRGK
ncbi:type III secretion system protein PrgE [Megasphaera stantonii]|uniref:type III secretion system protein PrgE n=1 Tax=Megasphaera stantonii TaxID=2144175 RepID=UPI000D16EBA1|nr:type III secretion system protein PrgE [Megasphaera stantonii]